MDIESYIEKDYSDNNFILLKINDKTIQINKEKYNKLDGNLIMKKVGYVSGGSVFYIQQGNFYPLLIETFERATSKATILYDPLIKTKTKSILTKEEIEKYINIVFNKKIKIKNFNIHQEKDELIGTIEKITITLDDDKILNYSVNDFINILNKDKDYVLEKNEKYKIFSYKLNNNKKFEIKNKTIIAYGFNKFQAFGDVIFKTIKEYEKELSTKINLEYSEMNL